MSWSAGQEPQIFIKVTEGIVLLRLLVKSNLMKWGFLLKLKLQYFGHLMQRTDSFEKTLMLRKIEGRRRRR